jgi:hypothetical protein
MNCFNGKLEYIWFRFFLHDRQLKTFRKIRSKSKDCAEGNNVVLLSLLVKHITLGHSSFIQCIALNITTRKFYLIRNVRKEAVPALGEIGDPIVLAGLEVACHDSDPDVRKSLRLAIVQINIHQATSETNSTQFSS